MCEIWKKEEKNNELTIWEIKKIFMQSPFRNLKEVIISGGEPFLRNDLTKIIEIIFHLTHSSIGITTNGLLSDSIFATVKKAVKERIPLKIYVSLDGSNPFINDKIRGVKSAFHKTFYTIRTLVKLQKKYKFELDVGTTIVRENITDILNIRKLVYSLKEKLGYGVRIAENTEYFSNLSQKFLYTEKEKKLLLDILEELKDGNIDFYYNAIKRFLLKNMYPKFKCTALTKSVYITPNGIVAPCSKYLNSRKIGDLRKQTIAEVLTKSAEYKEKIKNCSGCLDPCQWSWAKDKLAI
jgi:MoaA/NifB/PqqE/SkfB family radical SAM enzyme